MIIYEIILSDQAEADRQFWKKNSPKNYKRFLSLIDELKFHPRSGVGNPKTLKSDRTKWSREINKKDRMIYKIYNDRIEVEVLSARGHYDDH